MGTFPIPPSPAKHSTVQEYFRGIDLNNSPSNVDKSRSPAAPNMIRDQVGKVRKRMGYTTAAAAPNAGAINGVFTFGAEQLVHAGTVLYKRSGTVFTELCATMKNAISKAFLFDGKLYLLDGSSYRVYDGTTVTEVSASGYVPTIIISRKPGGGGTTYEAINMLSKKWTESFLGAANTTEYQLTDKALDMAAVEAEVMNSTGDWVKKTEGTDFTVNRATGVVTFTTAPGAPTVNGMDNVHISPSKARDGHLDNVNHCTVFSIYGVSGATDRVFLSGNAGKPGMDWYSGFENPTYFPDTGYTKISRDGSAVVGYAILSGTLATFLEDGGDGRNITLRNGMLDAKGEAVFKVVNTLIGESAAAANSFCYMGKEPLFLTNAGVYAIASEELTGEKYSQERSFYIRNALRNVTKAGDAFALVYRDFYTLAIGGDLYLLDGQQKTFEKNNPYSSYQYEAYYWPGIGARVLWQEGEALCFGRADGTLCRFATAVDSPESYNDNGAAIDAYWETGDYDGGVMFHNKTITTVACRLAAAVLTGVKIHAQKKGIWSLCYDAKETARYFDWSYIDFAKFVFSADRTPHTLVGKVKIKKVDKVRFRLQNSEKNEPFGIYAFGIEWKEPGSNYKG